ncbi:hypothetical protein TanjilG_20369 [Lupinus angustifolius]|uniref:Uncharacterized protein n=1 Tax=Lupinus angustifolius TaxID=3871 RepID=A0A4P1RW30_LUPAN|nr:hypothetical protein TanjilG_20369 [Lupinus angustifolius]
MDDSRVTQDLESLWFYTNMLTTTTHDNVVPSLTLPSINPNEPQKKTEEDRMEVVELSENVKRAKRDKKKERKRRKKNRSKVNKMEEVAGEVELEFDNVKVDDNVGGFLRYDKDSSSYDRYDYEIIANHYQNNLPPLDDVVAMKQHLKSWAHAVANSFK